VRSDDLIGPEEHLGLSDSLQQQAKWGLKLPGPDLEDDIIMDSAPNTDNNGPGSDLDHSELLPLDL